MGQPDENMWVLREPPGTNAGDSQKMKERTLSERELLDYFAQFGFVRRPLLGQALQGPLDFARKNCRRRFF